MTLTSEVILEVKWVHGRRQTGGEGGECPLQGSKTAPFAPPRHGAPIAPSRTFMALKFFRRSVPTIKIYLCL